MNRIDVRELLHAHAPQFLMRLPAILRSSAVSLLERTLDISAINAVLAEHGDKPAVDFIDEVFDLTRTSLLVSLADKNRIPPEGKLVVVANHPLGGLDGLAVVRMVKEVRPDVRIVANSVLTMIEPLKSVFLPIDVFGSPAKRDAMESIDRALEAEEAVVFFPAGEVSRWSLGGIRDRPWSQGAVKFARKHQAPILPIHVQASNRFVFYASSFLFRPLSTLLLSRELLHSRKKRIHLSIGSPVPHAAFSSLRAKPATQLFRKQVESLRQGKKGPFKTEPTIVQPTNSRLLVQELAGVRDLGSPVPGKRLYLATYAEAPSLVREIGRLRERTFRKIGEGTGKRLDIDRYDRTYHHLVLWDEERLTIAGAYRLGIGVTMNATEKPEFYTESLFEFSPLLKQILPASMELGRSFIPEEYQQTLALEYLWAGIGAVATRLFPVRYLFGPVSISNAFPAPAKESIVHVFRKWFTPGESMAASPRGFRISPEAARTLPEYFCGLSYQEDFNRLRLRLRSQGLAVPPLFRLYVDLCEEGGVHFHDFGVDPAFSDCIDGFMLLDLERLKEEKRERFITKYAERVLA